MARGARRATSGLLGLAVCLGGVLAGAPGRSEEKARHSYTVSPAAYRRLDEAMGFLSEERYAQAREVLAGLLKKKLNPHERALAFQIQGFVESSLERYPEAVAAFEKCVAENALPPGAQQNVLFNLGQLYLAEERYDDAVRTLKRWFETTEAPGALAYHLLAMAYYQQGRPDLALEPARTAVELAEDPQESWLSLLLALHMERQEYDRALPLLKQLAARFPKKSYWLQLSAVFAELGRDRDALATMQLAHAQGFLQTDGEQRNLARLYLYNEIPYWAARVITRGLDAGTLEPDAELWELLANAWLSAREYDRALEPLEKAARASDDGRLFVRLGQVRLEREEWTDAQAALRSALEKGGLDDPAHVHLLLGISSFRRERLDEATEHFTRAQRGETSRRAATQWLRHVEGARQRLELGS